MPLAPGQTLDGKYKVVRLIGEGGMGAVYEGENMRIARRVAIKALHAEAHASADVFRRFQREAQAAAKIRSNHIVDVLDLGDLPNGESYIVMEFLEGESFADLLKRVSRLPVRDTAIYAHQILEGLGAMHAVGIVHRDLKPANVFLADTPKGEIVKILDFGVSKFIGDSNTPDLMTRSGAVMGTPHYMSPEQARGNNKEVDARTDIYALGVILYRALSGVLPFDGENFHELLFKIALESPPRLETVVPELDPDFVQIVSRAMTRDPAGRFQSADEFRLAIEEWGRKQGRPSLQFDRTLRAGSSSVPAAPQVVVSITPSSEFQRRKAAEEGKSTPAAWSEGKAVQKQGGGLGTGPRMTPVGTSVEPRQSRRLVQAIAGGLGLLTALGVVLALRPKPSLPPVTMPSATATPTQSRTSDPATPTVAPTVPTLSSFADAAARPPANDLPSGVPVAIVPTVPTAAPAPKPVSSPQKPTATSTNGAAPSAPPIASSVSVPTAPVGTVRGRKIRTDL